MARSVKIQQHEAQAFCQHLPTITEVNMLLEQLGFRLALHMNAFQPRKKSPVAPLPEQFHYIRQKDGCEVIFLAGKDTPEGNEYLPSHASRFWVYSGADLQSYQRVIQTLSKSLSLTWRNLPRWIVLSA